ncbi:MAG TPA: FecR family protein [Terriglobales bacterium]|nr:FecR family protein [Terriglobales bacterium]
MKLRVRRAVLAAILCALVVIALPAFADSQARIVRLSFVDGSVEIDRNASQGFEKAITNMPITQGTKLNTGEDGEAEVEFENGGTIRLAPDTNVSFDQLSLRGDGGKVNLVSMERGTAYFNIKRKDEDEYRLVLNGRELQISKSTHFRVELSDRQAEVAVFKGELQLQGGEDEIKIKKNETLTLNLDEPDRYQLAKGIDEGQYDWWDQEREDYHSRYASNRYDSPYAYGWSDLNYYGNFINISGFGYAWRPYNVSFGWDPFASGYWVWYPGWGYTWVSPYPWGWMPFRYGRWRFFPGYGWAWVPGGWNTWYSAPPVSNPPPAYRPPAPPSTPVARPVPVGNPTLPPRPGPRDRRRQNDNDVPRWKAGERPVAPRPGATPGSAGSAVRPTIAPPASGDGPRRPESPGAGRGQANSDTRRGAGFEPPQRRPDVSPGARPVDTPRPAAPAARPSAPAARPSAPAPRPSPPSSPSRTFDGASGGRPSAPPVSTPRSSPASSPPAVRTPNPK